MFYVRLIAEADEKNQLLSAIHRCPNPHILRTYGSFCEKVEAALRDSETGAGNDDHDEFGALERRLVAALRLLLDFARAFADPVPGA